MTSNSEDENAQLHHALFPRDEDEEAPKLPIELIYIERVTSAGFISASRPLHPNELRTPADVAAHFGKGTYNLFARTAKGKIAAKRLGLKIDFGGEPRSMVVDAEDEPPPPPRATPAAMQGTMPTDPISMMMGFFQMMREDARANAERDQHAREQQAQRDQRAHEVNMAMQRENTAMLVAALQRPPPPADTTAAQVLGQVLAQVIPAAGRGVSPGVKDLKEMMDLVKAASPEAKKDDLDFQNLVAQTLGAYVATKEAHAQQQHPPPNGIPGPREIHTTPPEPAQPPPPPPQPTPTNPGAQPIPTNPGTVRTNNN